MGTGLGYGYGAGSTATRVRGPGFPGVDSNHHNEIQSLVSCL